MCSIDHTHLFYRLEMIRALVCDDSDARLTVSCFTRTNVTRTRPELFELRTTKDGVGEERRSEVMIVLD